MTTTVQRIVSSCFVLGVAARRGHCRAASGTLVPWSMRVNEQWRITFRFEDGHAHEVACEDYH